MKNGGKVWVCMISSLALCTAASAITDTAPYQGIVERNVFGLKPPPPPPDPEANKPPPQKIILTGILAGSVFGGKRALMKTPPAPVKPGQKPGTEEYYILNIGQRQGDIEVLDIDDKAGSVKVNNGGNVETLTLDKDGQKLPTTTPPAGISSPTGIIPPPMSIPGRGFNPSGGAPGFTMPTRAMRSNATTPGNPGMNPGMANGLVNGMANGVALPGFGSAQSGASAQFPQSTLSPEEQDVVIAAQYENAKMKGDPTAALFPPTRLTPNVNTVPMPGAPGSGTPNPQNPGGMMPPSPFNFGRGLPPAPQ